MTFKTAAAIISAASLLSCGEMSQPEQQKKSFFQSVDLPQTQVRNQEKAGFCWSFSALSLVESLHKSRTGEAVNLNEHAFVYAMHVAQLEELVTAYRRGYALDDIVKFSKQLDFQGWVMGLRDQDKEHEVLGRKKDVLDLLREFGTIREADWISGFNFKSLEQVQALAKRIQSGFERLVLTRQAADITRDDIHAILEDAWGTRPPQSISVRGESVTPQQYLKQNLAFEPDKFTAMGSWAEGASSRHIDRIIEATKLSLAAGYSVPIGFAVSFNALRSGKRGQFGFQNYDHTAFDEVSPQQAWGYVKDGGHAVLITDFKNVGGRFGKISKQQLVEELKKAPGQLEEVLVKNSWGFSASSNERGVEIVGSDTGYYTLNQGYLRLSADAGLLNIIVPRWIANLVKQNFSGVTQKQSFSRQQLSRVFSNSLIQEFR